MGAAARIARVVRGLGGRERGGDVLMRGRIEGVWDVYGFTTFA
jgi:hypothetical protein